MSSSIDNSINKLGFRQFNQEDQTCMIMSQTPILKSTDNILDSDDKECNSYSILKQSKKIKNDDLQNSKKKRQDMCLFQDKYNKNTQLQKCSYKHIDQYLYQNLETPKLFLIEGGIFIELTNPNLDVEDSSYTAIYNKWIKEIRKEADGTLDIKFFPLQAQNAFENVVQILQKTQNQDDYLLSLKIDELKYTLRRIRSQVEQVILLYNPSTLNNIIQSRQIYNDLCQKKFADEILTEDDFGSSMSYVIDWSLKSLGNKTSILTKPLVALFGGSQDDFIYEIFRKNLFAFVTSKTRNIMIRHSLTLILQNDQQDNNCISDHLEFKLSDGIFINCDVQIYVKHIQYPKELYLYDMNQQCLNNDDCISIVKLDITPNHLERVLNMRSQHIQKINEQMKIATNQNRENEEFAVQHFEYYLQSYIFLEKYYQNKVTPNKQDIQSSKNRCQYKFLTSNQINN